MKGTIQQIKTDIFCETNRSNIFYVFSKKLYRSNDIIYHANISNATYYDVEYFYSYPFD